jgi:hypothetical protein
VYIDVIPCLDNDHGDNLGASAAAGGHVLATMGSIHAQLFLTLQSSLAQI